MLSTLILSSTLAIEKKGKYGTGTMFYFYKRGASPYLQEEKLTQHNSSTVSSPFSGPSFERQGLEAQTLGPDYARLNPSSAT